jgi:hypothetical protein
MKSAYSIINKSETKQRYFEFMFLAQYYRWLASIGTATGNRSPITSEQYKLSSNVAHHKAATAGYKAIAQQYIFEARKIRWSAIHPDHASVIMPRYFEFIHV